jgi:hypothetical protein
MGITQDLLKELFYYREGKLFNRFKRHGKALADEEAGSLNNIGYRVINVKGKLYLSHRLIYIYHNGEIADGLHIDHIDRIRSNNNIENLRLVTRQENQWNLPAKGFHIHKPNNKFRAQIKVSGKLIHLGLFNTEEEARKAYLEAKKEFHKIKERI